MMPLHPVGEVWARGSVLDLRLRQKGYSMLVLSRKKNENIVINNDIIVTVIEIRGDKVRLGITAPKEVPVHRQEVYDRIPVPPGQHPPAEEVAGCVQYMLGRSDAAPSSRVRSHLGECPACREALQKTLAAA